MSALSKSLGRVFLLLTLLSAILPAPATASPLREDGLPPAASESGADVACRDGACKLAPDKQPDAVLPDTSDDESLLRLRAGAFDPAQGEPEITASLTRSLDKSQSGLRLLQFPGPILDEWYAALESSGLHIVTYIPDNAYLVWGDGVAMEALQSRVPLYWEGVYHPFYALHPALTQTSELPERVKVTVQVYAHDEVGAVVKEILSRSFSVVREPHASLVYRTMQIEIAAADLEWLSALPGVVNVEPVLEYELQDEIQGQIMAGNLDGTGTQPSGTGYLAWLDGLGFSTTASDYPIVDVTDDGIDDGDATPLHADFYVLGNTGNSDRLVYNYNWTSDATADGGGGHGNLNASIVAGYNTSGGYPYEDADGYNYGLGINPYGRVAGSKVFGNESGWVIGLTGTDLITNSYDLGARISSNSWGAATGGDYNADCQEYDALVRDALSGTDGNQEMIILFSAGNSGPGSYTIGSPGTAKNVITVGASENYRPLDTDGCGIGPIGANSAQDIISFSSRGPTDDDRVKPDLVAPGTHIMGAASQTSNFSGEGVCGAQGNDGASPPDDAYYPVSPAQTLYTWSSGTSHSTPAVAGAASLVYRYYQDTFGGAVPSPAMMKAYLVNATSYMTGVSANDDLPSDNQGYGQSYLARAFDNTNTFVEDQTEVFQATNDSYVITGTVSDLLKPLRVVLAWTDAPGPTTGNAYVNNLDLEVEIGGQTYLGNVFSGDTSVTGGAADPRNNVESVFLPAGTSGAFTVTVSATNIAGDGVPGNGDASDQDFALVVYNTTNASNLLGYLTGTVTESGSGTPISGAYVIAGTSTGVTGNDGSYNFAISPDTYMVTAQVYGYQPASVPGVVVSLGAVTTQDFSLSVSSSYLLTGTVTDADTGWPLYASVEIVPDGGYPAMTVWSDPWSGVYSATLMADHTHALNVNSWDGIPGYVSQSRSVILSANRYDENFALSADIFTCEAPGYEPDTPVLIFSESFDGFSSLPGGGWAQVDVSGTSGNWTIPTGGSNPTASPHSGSRMASFNSFNATSGHSTRLYRTSGWDMSSYQGASLNLWVYNYSGIWPGDDYVQVQVSSNGGTVWHDVGDPIMRDDGSDGHWVQYSVDLTEYTGAGMDDVRVAILGVSGYGWNIHIDDVQITSAACVIPTGGLMAGSVHARYTGSALTGATVSNQDGYIQTTQTTPDDDNVSESFYALYAPAGSKTFTATMIGYRTPAVVGGVSVVAGDTGKQDFLLGTAYVSQQTGNWSGSAWDQGSPGAGDWVTITTGHVVTVDEADAQCDGLTISQGATLVIPGGNQLTVDGVVHNSGTLRQTKYVSGAGEMDFHLRSSEGGVVYYGLVFPVSFNFGTTQVDITGDVINGSGTLDQTAGRWFDISPQYTPNGVPVTFYYRDAELNGNTASTLNVYHYSGSATWTLMPTQDRGGSGDARWVRAAIGSDGYSPFVLKSPGAPTALDVTAIGARGGVAAALLAVAMGALLLVRRKRRG